MEYSCKCISQDDNSGGTSFVGVFKNANEYSIITPYGFVLPKTINSTEREGISFLKKYARCITKALSKDKTRRFLQENCDSKNNPLSALNIVLDYVQNGPYKEFEHEFVIREKGKIDFKKTIARVKPIVVNEEALYTNFVVSQKKVTSQEIVYLAQGNVINHFMENGGEILFGNLIHTSVPKVALNNNLVNQLRAEKANSFNSRKQQLIQWIIDYIQGAANIKETGKWQYAIVASSLWEEMIDACYSNQVNRNKTIYGRVFKMYVNGCVVRTSLPTQHDTIYETEDEIIIIDAKMYQTATSLITSEVLEKQFGYYLTAKQKNPTKQIYNVLVKPYVKDIDETEGFIAKIPSPDMDLENDPNNTILIYAVDFEEILNAYYLGQKISNKLLEETRVYLKNS